MEPRKPAPGDHAAKKQGRLDGEDAGAEDDTELAKDGDEILQQLSRFRGLMIPQGFNDAQKTMGIIVLSLIIDKDMFAFSVPLWVIAVSVAGMALGTVLSGARLIRTLGSKFYRIRPVDSFSVQISSLFLMVASSLFGLPVSTTQLISSSIIGVGSAERLGKIRWNVANDILVSWILTIPATAALAAGVYWLLMRSAI